MFILMRRKMRESKAIAKDLGLVMSKETCIKHITRICDDMKDQKKRCRSTHRKREINNSIELLDAVVYHLSRESKSEIILPSKMNDDNGINN